MKIGRARFMWIRMQPIVITMIPAKRTVCRVHKEKAGKVREEVTLAQVAFQALVYTGWQGSHA